LEGRKYVGCEGSLEETFASQQYVARSNQTLMRIVKTQKKITI
jgi:hypothetical protein